MLVFPTFVQQSVQEGDIDAVEYSSSKATMSRAISVVESTAEDIMLYTVQDIPQLGKRIN
jgi:hypothetical protein